MKRIALPPRTRVALAAGLVCGTVCAPVFADAPTSPEAAAQPAAAADADNWFAQQLRRFRSHPHVERAYRLTANGNLEAAAAEFESGLAIDPKNADLRLELVQVLGRLGRHAAVIGHVDVLRHDGFDSPTARSWRANACQALGRIDEALADHAAVGASAAATAAQRRYAFKAIADIEIRRKHYAEALRVLEQVDPDGRDIDFLVRRATARQALGRGTEAEDDWRQVLAARPVGARKATALAALARIQEQRGRVDAAIDNLREAVAAQPASPDLTRSLARLSWRAGHPDEAVQWTRRTVELRGNAADREFLADLLMASADFAGAVREYGRLLAEAKSPAERERLSSALAEAREAQAPDRGADATAPALASGRDGRSRDPLARAGASGSVPSAGSTTVAVAGEPAGDTFDPGRTSLDVAYQAGNYQEAIRWASWIVKRRPDPKDREFLANLLYAQKDYAAAAREYRAVLAGSMDVDHRRRMYMALGFACAGQRAFAQAADAFGNAVALSPEPEAVDAWLRSLESAGEPGPLLRGIERALAIRPSAELRLRLGQLQLQTGHGDRAMTTLRAVAGQPDAPAATRADAWRTLARLHQSRAEPAAAREVADRLLALLPDDPTAHLLLARLDLDGNAPEAALPHLRRAVEVAPSAEGWRLLAHAHGVLGQWPAAVVAWQSGLRLRGLDANEREEAHRALGHAQGQAGDWAGAAKTFEALRDLPGQSPQARRDAVQRIVNAYSVQGRHADAAAALEAAIAAGDNDPQLHRSSGFARFSASQWREALVHFRAAHDAAPTAETAVAIARCYERLHMPGLTIHYLSMALDEPGGGEPGLRRDAYAQLGYLYAESYQYATAASMFERSVALRDDTATAFRAARMHWLAGEKEPAATVLEAIAPGALPAELEVQRLDMLAEVEGGRGHEEAVTAALERAQALAPSPEREHALGLRYLAAGRRERAIELLASAHRSDPRPQYADSLRNALFEAERFDEAAALLGSGPDHAVERIAFFQNVAYHWKRLSRNAEAVAWFKRGVDEALAERETRVAAPDPSAVERRSAAAPAFDVAPPRSPAGTVAKVPVVWREDAAEPPRTSAPAPVAAVAQAAPEAAPDLDQRLAGMRNEIRNLEDNFDLTLYESYRAKSRGPATSTVAASPSGGVVPSQGGLEFAWRPPEIGLRDERTLQVFGRMLWSNRPGSLRIEDSSLQAGAGVRYKPLQAHQLYVSGERLVKVGSNATSDWLLRLAYGWTDGFEARPGQTSWNYTTAYGDAGYFARSRTKALYAEVRQGRSFAVADGVVLTPHLVADGRTQSPDPADASYLEAGAGLSAKISFDRSRYEGYRSSAEFLVHYKHGFSHVPSGWLVTAVVRY